MQNHAFLIIFFLIWGAILYSNDEFNLSIINYFLLQAINKILGIQTKITSSRDYILEGDRTQKLLNICKQANASIYVSGPKAKSYFDENLAQENGIQVEWMDYSGYREYTQLYPPFVYNVSILDLIFNEGENAKMYLKSFNSTASADGRAHLALIIFYSFLLSFFILLRSLPWLIFYKKN